MIHIIKSTPNEVVFEKTERKESWFDNKCNNENLLIQCNRPEGVIDRIKWDDGKYMSSLLHVFFK